MQSFGGMQWRFFLIIGLWLTLAAPGAAPGQEQNAAAIDALPEVPLSQLSEPGNTLLGRAAMAVRPGDWKHAETPHFILHFFRNFVAAQAAVELEYYYHVISTELHKDTSTWERKSQVYIFENQTDWQRLPEEGAARPVDGRHPLRGEPLHRAQPGLQVRGAFAGA